MFGSVSVPATVDRLPRNPDRPPSRSVAAVDLTAGSADPAAGGQPVASPNPAASPSPVPTAAAPGPAGPAVPVPLRPTVVVLVSTPESEAPLLAAAPSLGLDLPLRFVVWLDDQQRTQIGYPDPRAIASPPRDRRGQPERHPVGDERQPAGPGSSPAG